jgi:phosphoglycerate-specific signal transduction histidine kinase
VWQTGRLARDFKTIADFRKDNGEAIRLVCREFVMLCRKLALFTDAFVAIDESIERYLGQIASADRQEAAIAKDKTQRLEDKIAALKEEIKHLKKLEVRMLQAPDQQITLTDPDARSMATSGRGMGMVGYNIQTAVDANHDLIVAHEMTNVGNDRTQLAKISRKHLEVRRKACLQNAILSMRLKTIRIAVLLESD